MAGVQDQGTSHITANPTKLSNLMGHPVGMATGEKGRQTIIYSEEPADAISHSILHSVDTTPVGENLPDKK